MPEEKPPLEEVLKQAAKGGIKVLCPFDTDCVTAQLHEQIAKLRIVMGKVAMMLETEESSPKMEAERLRGALAGFEAPPMDLSFLNTKKEQIVKVAPEPGAHPDTDKHLGVIMKDFDEDFRALADYDKRSEVNLCVPGVVAMEFDIEGWARHAMTPGDSGVLLDLRPIQFFVRENPFEWDSKKEEFRTLTVQRVNPVIRDDLPPRTLILMGPSEGARLEEVYIERVTWDMDRKGATTEMRIRLVFYKAVTEPAGSKVTL